MVDGDSGRVVVLTTHKNGQDDEVSIVIGQGVDTSRVWLYSSDDDGTTWSGGNDITSTVKRPGRRTWRIGAVADPTDGPRPDESTAAQLPDGTLVFSTRNQDDAATWHRLRSTSTDAGSTYAEPFAPQVGLVMPIVQGSLSWTGGAKGRLLFSAPSSPTDPVDLTVRSSVDAGVTWSDGTLIAPGPAGYSDLVELPGGLVGVFHEAGTTAPFERIDLTVVGADRLR